MKNPICPALLILGFIVSMASAPAFADDIPDYFSKLNPAHPRILASAEREADVKELLKAVTDTINARMETMTLKEKSALIDQVSNINDKIDEKNPIMEREIDRLEKEAKEKGITVGADL